MTKTHQTINSSSSSFSFYVFVPCSHGSGTQAARVRLNRLNQTLA